MLVEYAVVFMLFASVLSAAWFYLMRAKARDARKAANAATPAPASEERTDEALAA